MESGKYAKNRYNHYVLSLNGKKLKYDDLYLYNQTALYTKGGLDCDYCITEVEEIDTKEKSALISFLGTNSTIDVFHDILFFPKRIKIYDKTLKVHKGAWKEYNSIRNELLDKLYEIYDKTKFKNVYIIGHSLGAMIATICAEDVYFHFSKKPTLICFESPNVCGNKKTRDYIEDIININSIFFVNGKDIITRLPTIPFGYSIKDFIYYFDLKNSIFDTPTLHTTIDNSIKRYMKPHVNTVEED